ncbi:LacI family DNA-binding transcriptional regulator [Nakamurella lactea]|uniref:LacI family DNA-binding transcriptional regulator n=1 Tax=Nakamurella lactea TaxID=459515 RepID=UPI00055C6681|nr:LacI family DNA-binding transcriptional regulator [Nakamurella lactea]
MRRPDPTRRTRPVAADVARAAGVSMATVSNFLNRPQLVAPNTGSRIDEAMRQLGYVPHGAARQLAAGRSRLISLVVLDLANPFFLEVARGVEDVASRNGYVVTLFNSDDSPTREQHALQAIEELRVSGLLISPVGAHSTMIGRVRADGLPTVLLDRGGSKSEGCSVAVDDHSGGVVAGEHLIAAGLRRFAFVGGSTHLQQHRARLRGLKAAMRGAGIADSDLIIVREQMSVAGGLRAGEELLARSRGPIGVFCGNDLLAMGVERAVLTAGRRVPDDFAIVGYDDLTLASTTAVPLTSIAQPMYDLGSTAARLLIDEIQSAGHQHERVQFKPQLIARDSTPATDRPGAERH